MYGTDTVQIQTELTEILTSRVRARARVGDERGQAASCHVEEGRQDTDERQLLGVLGATRGRSR